MARWTHFSSLAVLVALIAACGGSDGDGTTMPPGGTTVASISVTPNTPSVTVGGTVQLTAMPKGADGATLTGKAIAWSSSATAVATVSANGLVAAVAAGSATITATAEGKSGQATVTITPAPPPPPVPVATVAISPVSASLVPAQSVSLTVTLQDASGNTLTGRPVTWQSSSEAVAIVNTAGTVTAVAPGSATITATSEGKDGTRLITVVDGAMMTTAGGTVNASSGDVSLVFPANAITTPTAITVAPASNPPSAAGLVSGTAYELGPSGTFAQHVTVNIRYTAAAAAGRVPADFRIHRLTGGVWVEVPGGSVNTTTRVVTAPTSSFSTYAVVQVIPPVHTVTLAAAASSINVGGTAQVTATLRDAANNVLTGRTVTWESSHPAVASVSASGLVTGVAAGGPVTITAQSEGKSGTTAVTVVAVPPPFAFASISASDMLTCGLTPAGAAYCWGNNPNGEVGDGSTTRRTIPTPVAGGHTFSVIAAGAKHACALDANGLTWCWGNNEVKQLGREGPNQSTPLAVPTDLRFAKLTAGHGWTCGITAAGAAWCWGYATDGALGNGQQLITATPQAVAGSRTFVKLAAGDHHTCGIDNGGLLWCWGDNLNGELGNGTRSQSLVPVQVSTLSAVIDVAVGEYHSCAVTSAGTAWCWGENLDSRSGGGSAGDVLVPQQVSGPGFTKVGIGQNHSCALSATGVVYCWGRNNWGQFGDNSPSSGQRGTAGPVAGGVALVTLTSGWNHLCGLTAAGEAWCWGQNPGALGDGTSVSRFVPTKVSAPGGQ